MRGEKTPAYPLFTRGLLPRAVVMGGRRLQRWGGLPPPPGGVRETAGWWAAAVGGSSVGVGRRWRPLWGCNPGQRAGACVQLPKPARAVFLRSFPAGGGACACPLNVWAPLPTHERARRLSWCRRAPAVTHHPACAPSPRCPLRRLGLLSAGSRLCNSLFFSFFAPRPISFSRGSVWVGYGATDARVRRPYFEGRPRSAAATATIASTLSPPLLPLSYQFTVGWWRWRGGGAFAPSCWPLGHA